MIANSPAGRSFLKLNDTSREDQRQYFVDPSNYEEISSVETIDNPFWDIKLHKYMLIALFSLTLFEGLMLWSTI
ncbi:MAG: hypothetical protein FJX80_16400 [Bacteroidetes bacterium]|nr:hypothetical protein [Bacteroidota bacterium]